MNADRASVDPFDVDALAAVFIYALPYSIDQIALLYEQARQRLQQRIDSEVIDHE